MKKVYLVRHGETDGNVGIAQQGPDTPLNERGRAQRIVLANRVADITFDRIVSSTMRRARETAESIVERTEKPIVYSDLFVERRRPSAQVGQRKDSEGSLAYERFVKEHFGRPGARFADEENFEDLRDRALKALSFLKESPSTDLVVGHGIFARIMLACAVFGPSITGHECQTIVRTFRTMNTGITVLEHRDIPRFPWRVWSWNDHAHL